MDTYYNSKLCQTCARCCKNWVTFLDNAEEAWRAELAGASVLKIRPSLWRVRFNLPCKMLRSHGDGEDIRYSCRSHDKRPGGTGDRPELCKRYPINFFDADADPFALYAERDYCPALRDLISQRNKEKREARCTQVNTDEKSP